MKFYQYPKCNTCKKAQRWLTENEIEVESIHIVDEPPTREQIETYWQRSGLDLKKFFNTSGKSYRALNLKDTYAGLSDDQRLDLLGEDGKLIKRPVLVADDFVLVGFREDAWRQQLLADGE